MALADDFKNALSAWASGASVVTTRADGLAYGLTVSSFTSVSLDPPLVLVCLGHGNRMVEMITRSQRFAVSLLAREQEEASNHFASRGREPEAQLSGVPTVDTEAGVPVETTVKAAACCPRRDLAELARRAPKAVAAALEHADAATSLWAIDALPVQVHASDDGFYLQCVDGPPFAS